MYPEANLLSGGQLVVKTLEHLGCERIFSVPGESYLEVLDALYDSPINNTICRQEGGAAMMAEAWGKATNSPGICFVTRGPGATNASAGLHVAQQDSTPMILFIGQINSAIRHREGFQELDYRQVFGSMAKWVAEIDSAERVEEMVGRAWSIATSGRQGPVVLVLPEDCLAEQAKFNASKPRISPVSSASEDQLKQLTHMLDQAKQPLVIAGGSGWGASSCRQLQAFAESFNLPVAVSFRRQMLFDHLHSHYAGDVGLGINPQLAESIRQADVVVLFNARFSEVPSQNYSLLNIPYPQQQLIHIYPDSNEHGKLYAADLNIIATPKSLLSALQNYRSTHRAVRQSHVEHCHNNYLSWSELPQRQYPGSVQMPYIVNTMQALLPEDAIIANGAGNYATWIHRFWRFRQYGTQLAPTSGSMGYGLPGAIAGKLANPEKTVVCMAGDGCFQMTMQELATAVQAQANIIVILIDNGIYGTIRMHQEKRFPGRVSGTHMVNPEFAQLADAYGIFSAKVTCNEDFIVALEQALHAQSPSLIHVVIDPQTITPGQTIEEIRQASQPKQTND